MKNSNTEENSFFVRFFIKIDSLLGEFFLKKEADERLKAKKTIPIIFIEDDMVKAYLISSNNKQLIQEEKHVGQVNYYRLGKKLRNKLQTHLNAMNDPSLYTVKFSKVKNGFVFLRGEQNPIQYRCGAEIPEVALESFELGLNYSKS